MAKKKPQHSEVETLIAETREAMLPELRELADQNFALVRKEADTVLDCYDIGTVIAKITNNERKYGESAVRQLAIVWYGTPQKEQDLHGYRYVAQAYERKHLQSLLKSAGSTVRLSFGHVRMLARLNGNANMLKRREKLERRVLDEGLSTRDLKIEVNRALGGGKQSNGGRGAAPPRSPIHGLQQLVQQLRTLQGREEIVKDFVLGPLGDMEEEAVTPELVEVMQTAYSAIDEATDMLKGFASTLGELIEASSQTLVDRGEATPEIEETDEADSDEDETAEDVTDDVSDDVDAADLDEESEDAAPRKASKKAKKAKKAKKKRRARAA